MPDIEVSNLITVEQAMEIIDAAPIKRRVARDKLANCAGSYLAEDVLADRDSPPFDKSVMDGFAVRSQDVQAMPCELELVGQVTAGESAEKPVGERQAMAIMTGAPLPPGSDAVVPIEMTSPAGTANRIVIHAAVKPGQSIAKCGCEAKAGSVVLKTGMRLEAAQLAVAASVGAYPLVYATPYVGILETGDELVSADQTPTGSQIRASNASMLSALLTRFPCSGMTLGIVRDDPQLIEQKIHESLSKFSHDILLITGGMSMGERDYVPGILKRLGGNLKITKLRIKPGKPFVFAEMPNGKFVFGLPGNPVSTYVCTLVLVSRLIQRMAGGSPDTPTKFASLAEPLEANGPRTFYQPAIFDGHTLSPLKWIGSADIYTLSKANALLIRPENQSSQPIGAATEFIEI